MSLIPLALLCAMIANAAPVAKSGRERVPMVELYSSESCSSCPPADNWLGRLEKDPLLWKKFVPIAFQVDYWNHLNWKDELSTPEASERQKAHVRSWADGALYTPAFILNGEEWRDWPDKKSVPLTKQPEAGELEIWKTELGWRVDYRPVNKAAEDLTIHLATVGFGIRQKIGAGENSGLTLTHNFVVLNWQHKFVMKPVKGKFSSEFSAFTPKKAPPKSGLIAWVQQGSAPKPLQSTGTFLKPKN